MRDEGPPRPFSLSCIPSPMGLLTKGRAMLKRCAEAEAGVRLTLRRGDLSAELLAVPGRHPTESETAGGTILVRLAHDWLLHDPTQYTLDGVQCYPQQGDVLETLDEATTRTFAVLPIDGEDCYQELTPTLWRIHSKRIE